MKVSKVLIIDPNKNSLQYLAEEVNKAGYDVFSETSGKEGLISAWRERPHVVVIGPIIPDIPIEELLHKLRYDRRTSRRSICQ